QKALPSSHSMDAVPCTTTPGRAGCVASVVLIAVDAPSWPCLRSSREMRKHLGEDTRSAALQCDADSENRMEGTMIATQSELKALFDDQAEAIRTKDVD